MTHLSSKVMWAFVDKNVRKKNERAYSYYIDLITQMYFIFFLTENVERIEKIIKTSRSKGNKNKHFNMYIYSGRVGGCQNKYPFCADKSSSDHINILETCILL